MDIARTKQIVAELLKRTTDNGCTESEVACAIAKVQQLLAQHGMSVRDIPEEKEVIVESKVETETKSLSSIQAHIALSLQEHFGVGVVRTFKTWGNESCLKVIGEPIKVEIFTETFLFAYKAFKFNWSNYAKKLTCSTREKNLHRGAYLRGYCDGFTNEIIRQENATALVVVKSEALKEHIAKMGSMSKHRFCNPSSSSEEAYAEGYETGSFAQRGKEKVLQD